MTNLGWPMIWNVLSDSGAKCFPDGARQTMPDLKLNTVSWETWYKEKFVLQNPIAEIPSCRNLIPFPQETLFSENLSTAAGIRVNRNFPLISNGKTIYDPYEKCNLFNIHFASVSTLPDEKLGNVNLPNFSIITDQSQQPLVVESFDVYSVVSNLNPAKWKGFKNLPNLLLKSCSQSLEIPLSLLFNFILASEQFPLQWENRLNSTSSQDRISLRCNELQTHCVTSFFI